MDLSEIQHFIEGMELEECENGGGRIVAVIEYKSQLYMGIQYTNNPTSLVVVKVDENIKNPERIQSILLAPITSEEIELVYPVINQRRAKRNL